VVTATRSDALPDIPARAEFVPGYEASSWYGVDAPKATPAEIIDKLKKEINAALADPKNKVPAPSTDYFLIVPSASNWPM
jgi:tripartite-type tricarboxylate transporter receptor subunit TctC